MNKNATAAVVVAALAAAGAGGWWWTQRDTAGAEQWRTARVARGTLTAAVSASGTINPVASVQVGSQVSGQIRDVLVDFNSPVKAGQEIARIDPQTFQQQVRQAQADLDAARAQVAVQQSQVSRARADVTRAEVNLADARLDLSRKEQLVERNFISPADRDKSRAVARAIEQDLNAARASLDVALAQVRNAEATVKQREAALANAQVNLDRSVIRSPVDGVVIKRSIEPGQTVAASLQSPELFVIAKNLRDMQVDTAIDESDVGRMREGQRATFTVDAFPGRVFEGTVDQVRKAAQNVQNVVTYNVVVRFVNEGGQLLPGMTANVRVATETRDDVLMVPNAALRFRPPVEAGKAGGGSGSTMGSAPESGGGARVAAGGLAAGGRANGGRANGGQPGGGPADGGSADVASTPDGQVDGEAGASRAAALHERLERELDLSAEQRQRLDEIFRGMRPRFAALRAMPEAQRASAMQAARSELRAQIVQILTPPQRVRYETIAAEATGRAAGGGLAGRGRVHVLEGGRPQPVEVRTGISDGTQTEVASPQIAEGTEVVVGRAGGPASPGAAGGGTGGSATRPGGPPTRFF